jgi:hypothetical protein
MRPMAFGLFTLIFLLFAQPSGVLLGQLVNIKN